MVRFRFGFMVRFSVRFNYFRDSLCITSCTEEEEEEECSLFDPNII